MPWLEPNLDVLPLEGDDSTKTGIPANTLPPLWALRANITFNRLGEYAFRPDHWSDYARSIKERRETATNVLEQIAAALDRYFRDPGHADMAGHTMRVEVLDDASRLLNRLPPFPKDAVDGWGQTSESAAQESERDSPAKLLKDIIPALQEHAGYLKALGAYFSPLGNFVQQSGVPLAAVPYFARAKHTKEVRVLQKALGEKRAYVAKRSTEVSALAAEAIAGMSNLATALTRAMAETDNDAPRGELLAATVESLRAFWDVLLPEGLVDGKGTLGDEEMKQWNERMATGMSALAEMKLAFVAYQHLIGGLV